MDNSHAKAELSSEPGLETEYESPIPQADTVFPAELRPDNAILDKLMADFISFPLTPEAAPAAIDLESVPAYMAFSPVPDQAENIVLKKENSPSLTGAMDKHKQRPAVPLSRCSPLVAFSGPDFVSSSDSSESAPITPRPIKVQIEFSINISDPLCNIDG